MSEQSEKQSVEQLFSGFGQEVTNAIYRAVDHKKAMTAIILEEITDQDKVTKLRKSILQYRAHKDSVEETGQTQKDVSTKDLPSLNGIETSKLRFLAELIQTMTKPLKEHEELVEKITKIIRQENVLTERKVDEISNLLM